MGQGSVQSPFGLVRRTARRLAALLLASLLASGAAAAAAPVHTLGIPLDPLIERVAGDENRFAVDVPHAVTLDAAGLWSTADGVARWEYAVSVPTAISLSARLEDVVLPAGAQLSIGSGTTRRTYTRADVRRGTLWSRIVRGATLNLTLTVPQQARTRTFLRIMSLQAGYRSLGADSAEHPAYRRYREKQARSTRGQQAASNPNAGCITNFQCRADNTTTGPGLATVALVIANQLQCTGTLVNNALNDGMPYVLTARHCQIDSGPDASASATTVYWNAVSSCGATLGDLYDPTLVTQTGSSHIVEQQDAWLILLDQSPVIANAFFAGLDAGGAAPIGGFTPHHALSTKKQIVEWSGQAAPIVATGDRLDLPFDSDFWGVVSQLGFYGPGASGGGLFDANGRLVGIASRGTQTNGGPGSCPAGTPPAPSEFTANGFFTSLAAVWNSTADGSSSTGSATIANVLTAGSPATTIVGAGSGLAQMTLRASQPAAPITNGVTLQWDASGASSCTGSGGQTGDGWEGPRATTGPFLALASVAGDITYRIECSYPSGRIARSAALVRWTPPDPTVRFDFTGDPRLNRVWVGGPLVVRWIGNAEPCSLTTTTATGAGTSALSGLPSNGSATLVFTTPGDGQVEIACGPAGATQARAGTSYTVSEPAVGLSTTATDRRTRQPFRLFWDNYADYCTPSGGAPDDGWSRPQVSGQDGSSHINPLVTGDFVYMLTCSAGDVSVTEQVSVRVTDDPPYVNLDITPSTLISGDPTTVTLQANIGGCMAFNLPGTNLPLGLYPTSSGTYAPTSVGTFEVWVECSGNGERVVSPIITMTVLERLPLVELFTYVSTGRVEIGGSFTLDWEARNATDCEADGAPDFQGPLATSGSVTITPTAVGMLELVLSCSNSQHTYVGSISIEVVEPAPPPPPPAPPPESGGGSTDPWNLAALLGALAWLRRTAGRTTSTRRHAIESADRVGDRVTTRDAEETWLSRRTMYANRRAS